MTMLYAGHRGREDPAWLYKLPGCLMVHVRSWNPEVPVLRVANHSVRALGDRNGNIRIL